MVGIPQDKQTVDFYQALFNRKAEYEIVLRLIGQSIFALLPVGHRPSQGRPERGTVMRFAQMNEFVGDDVIHQAHWNLEDFPVEEEDPFLAA